MAKTNIIFIIVCVLIFGNFVSFAQDSEQNPEVIKQDILEQNSEEQLQLDDQNEQILRGSHSSGSHTGSHESGTSSSSTTHDGTSSENSTNTAHQTTIPHSNQHNVHSDGEETESHEDGEGAHGETGGEHGEGSEHHEEQKYQPGEPLFYFFVMASIGLVCFAGICSGLTVGYLSLDALQLEITMENGTEAQKKAVKSIIPILENHHVLLSTLLICNAIAMEALPVFLDAVVPSYLAVFISTVAVVLVGEIIPQAYCTGPSQLLIAEKMAPLVRVLILVFSCFTKYIAKFLDDLLGTHQKKRYTQKEIGYLLSLYESVVPKCNICQLMVSKIEQKEGKSFKCNKCEQFKQMEKEYFWCENSCDGQIICLECFESVAYLYGTEVTVFKSVLDKISAQEKIQNLEKKDLISSKAGFVPIEKVVMVNVDEKVCKKSIQKLTKNCFSNVLVKCRETNDIVGVVKIKQLIQFADKDTNLTFGSRMFQKITFVNDNTKVLDLINSFKDDQTSKIAVVLAPNDNNYQNSIPDFSERNVVDIQAVQSLAPANQMKKRNVTNRHKLEHNGQKIIGIFTLKDVFEDLINLDFGESNQEDEDLRKNIEEQQNEIQTQNKQAILQIIGHNKKATNILSKEQSLQKVSKGRISIKDSSKKQQQIELNEEEEDEDDDDSQEHNDTIIQQNQDVENKNDDFLIQNKARAKSQSNTFKKK